MSGNQETALGDQETALGDQETALGDQERALGDIRISPLYGSQPKNMRQSLFLGV